MSFDSNAASQSKAVSEQDITNAKSEWRKRFRREFNASADPAVLLASAEALNSRLAQFLSLQSGTWGAFQPAGFEPDIRSALAALTQIDWVFPRVESGDDSSEYRMEFYRLSSSDQLVLNRWGILEPDPSCAERVSLSELSGLLVPGLCFDMFCNRMGRGGGYYDRTLARLNDLNLDLITVGIAFDRQIASEALPVEPFDLPVHWVVTESRRFARESANGRHDGPLPERKNP